MRSGAPQWGNTREAQLANEIAGLWQFRQHVTDVVRVPLKWGWGLLALLGLGLSPMVTALLS